jgi:DNA-binding GntR family transcriptional regulator
MLRVVAEHDQIVDCVEARNEQAALAALRAHLRTSEYILTASMGGHGSPA